MSRRSKMLVHMAQAQENSNNFCTHIPATEIGSTDFEMNQSNINCTFKHSSLLLNNQPDTKSVTGSSSVENDENSSLLANQQFSTKSGPQINIFQDDQPCFTKDLVDVIHGDIIESEAINQASCSKLNELQVTTRRELQISPPGSFYEDSDDSVKDPHYESDSSSSCTSSNSGSNSSTNSEVELNVAQVAPLNESPEEKKGRKRKRSPNKWNKNAAKRLRNFGLEYKANTKSEKIVKARQMKGPCTEKCRLKCFEKITPEERENIFKDYWGMGDLQRQRDFIVSSMCTVQPKYRYCREDIRRPRQPNNAFYFFINQQRIRVCKLFFKNTLDINDRPIRTVIDKKQQFTKNIITKDNRGKHGQHKKVDEVIKNGVRDHIAAIPAIESHYIRAHTTRKFIDGSKSIADIHRDYVNKCTERNEPHANYILFNRIFNLDFNISFFIPKKDQCELCVSFQNIQEEEEKKAIKEKYDQHLVEKNLSRVEKQRDKENVDINTIVVCYDLQAVFQCPKGDISVFYYKSKLNVFNFTIYELKTNDVECFVWHEAEASRGPNEIGSCLLKYIEKKVMNSQHDLDFIFYSDNCGGQQKNRFIFSLYMYAVSKYPKIKSITHKYLITGHTQNEGDSAHSIIERQVKRNLKSGPIYTPDQFVSAIRSAKKTGKAYQVTELSFEDFLDIKGLTTDMGTNFTKNLKNEKFNTNDLKILRVENQHPHSLFYKSSYQQEDFEEINMKKRRTTASFSEIELSPAFAQKPKLPDSKKSDLMELLRKNDIPKCYSGFYQSL